MLIAKINQNHKKAYEGHYPLSTEIYVHKHEYILQYFPELNGTSSIFPVYSNCATLHFVDKVQYCHDAILY